MAFDALKRLFQRGDMARTPEFLPKSTGVSLGEKTAPVVLPIAKPIAPAVGTPTEMRPPAPVETAAPMEGLRITPREAMPQINPAGFFNQGQPYRDLRNEAKFREQFSNGDFSNRQYADPYTQAKYDKVYGEPMAQGKSVQDLERPGVGGRLKLALMGALMGAANNPTGDIGGLIGGALGGAAGSAINPTRGREWQYDMGEGRQVAEQIGREQQQQGVQARLAEIFARMGANQARARAAQDRAGLERERWEYEQRNPKPVVVPEGSAVRGGDGTYSIPAPRRQSPIPVSPGATLLDPVTRQPIYTNPAAEKEPSLSDFQKMGELETAANYDPSGERAKWMTGVRPEIYKRLGISPQIEALAQNAQPDETGEFTPSQLQAMRMVQQAEDLLEQEYKSYEEHKKKQLGAQATLKKMQGAGKTGGGKKTAVNLYQYDGSRYGFKD